MPRGEKPSPIGAFEDNMADAEVLVSYARAFRNQRAKRMRKELRDRVGEALRIGVRRREAMDCLESADLFVVFRDKEKLGREQFKDARPLLRQAIVAACAAFETYVADKVMTFVGQALRADEIPRRLGAIPLTVGRWTEIEDQYERRKWGIRTVIEEAIREMSSTAPNRVGEVLGVVGFSNWARRVDDQRGVAAKTTVHQLEQITARRNKIAHSADRAGQGRAQLEIREVQTLLQQVQEIVTAMEAVMEGHQL